MQSLSCLAHPRCTRGRCLKAGHDSNTWTCSPRLPCALRGAIFVSRRKSGSSGSSVLPWRPGISFRARARARNRHRSNEQLQSRRSFLWRLAFLRRRRLIRLRLHNLVPSESMNTYGHVRHEVAEPSVVETCRYLVCSITSLLRRVRLRARARARRGGNEVR